MTLIRGVATIQFLAACVLYSIHQDLKQHLVFVLLIQGGFQMYMRVSHFPGEAGSPDFSPPFTDPLIDEAFSEFSLPATLFPDRFMPQSDIGCSGGIWACGAASPGKCPLRAELEWK